MRRLILVCVCAIVSLMGLSWLTSRYYWDGGFPFCEIHVYVVDETGRPIEDARMDVIDERDGSHAFGYPFQNNTQANPLKSNASGVIVASQEHMGPAFGGHGWKLFWVFPIQDAPPKYKCRINAHGLEPTSVDIEVLFFESRATGRSVKRKLNTKNVDLPIRCYTIILRGKGDARKGDATRS